MRNVRHRLGEAKFQSLERREVHFSSRRPLTTGA
jgi:hypothetical protein